MAVKQHVPELKTPDLAMMLKNIKELRKNPSTIPSGDKLIIWCENIIIALARIKPPNAAEELSIFNPNISEVRKFLNDAIESCPQRQDITALNLKFLYSTITDPNIKPYNPCSVVLNLVEKKAIPSAVTWLLMENHSPESLQRALCVLLEWLPLTTVYTPGLSDWVICFMDGLQEQNQWDVLTEALSPNIIPLLHQLWFPAIRPFVAPVLIHALYATKHDPVLLLKILPYVLPVLQGLSKENNGSSHEIKNTLVGIITELLNIFPEVRDQNNEIYQKLQTMGSSAKHHLVLHEIIIPIEVNTVHRVGLNNLGNTCYMNSVLQALLMTKQFCKEIIKSNFKSPVIENLANLFALLKYSQRSHLSPKAVLQRTRPPGFIQGYQHDSSEFLGYLLDILHEQEKETCIVTKERHSARLQAIQDRKQLNGTTEQGANKRWATEEDLSSEELPKNKIEEVDFNTPGIVTLKGVAKYKTGENDLPSNVTYTTDHSAVTENNFLIKGHIVTTDRTFNNENIDTKVNCNNNMNSDNNTTITQSCFSGHMVTVYQCTLCGVRSTNQDMFRDMQLSFPDITNDVIIPSNELFTVQQLLDFYLSKEVLNGENKYWCEECKALCDAERSIDILRAPNNLILTLKHFLYNPALQIRAKLLHKVVHNKLITLNVLSHDGRGSECVLYQLYAAVVHSGNSMDSGHYYTYAMDEPDCWFKFNDGIVTPSTADELHSLKPPNTPYILFYKRLGTLQNIPEVNEVIMEVDNDIQNRQNDDDQTMDNQKHSTLNLGHKFELVKFDANADYECDFPNLPLHLQKLVVSDNDAYSEELKLNQIKTNNYRNSNNYYNRKDDDADSSGGSNCGANSAIISDVYKFIY